MALDAMELALGSAQVHRDVATLGRMSSDLHHDGTVGRVVRPRTIEELQTVLRIAAEEGRAVVPRGGGVSYTAGYVIDDARAVMVDTQGLDRIVEVNVDDGYVTVESGVTWQALRSALRPLGVRTPFEGPFSGAHATVGGTLSQNAVVWGAAEHGGSADTVLAVCVALADGSLLRTGTSGGTLADGDRIPPFLRGHGPDLTGLFLGDCGAFGIKATITLPLIAAPAVEIGCCATFTTDDDLMLAVDAVAASGLASTIVATDAAMARQRLERMSRERGDATSVADPGHTLHIVVDGNDAEVARSRADTVTAIVRAHRGAQGDVSVTNSLIEHRFLTMTSSVGPSGERWAPLHGMFRRSDARRVWAEMRALEAELAGPIERFGIVAGYLVTTIRTQTTIIEPALYWPGSRRPIHDLILDDEARASLPGTVDDIEALAFVARYRVRLLEIFRRAGAAHLQVGRTYPWATNRDPVTLALATAIKQALDPEGRMNPGVLGL